MHFTQHYMVHISCHRGVNESGNKHGVNEYGKMTNIISNSCFSQFIIVFLLYINTLISLLLLVMLIYPLY